MDFSKSLSSHPTINMKKLYIGSLGCLILGLGLLIWGYMKRNSFYLSKYNTYETCSEYLDPSTGECGIWSDGGCLKGGYDPKGLSICMASPGEASSIKYASVAVLFGVIVLIVSGVLGYVGYSVK
jgi:hypothetical protein